jgi:hypothetical protein
MSFGPRLIRVMEGVRDRRPGTRGARPSPAHSDGGHDVGIGPAEGVSVSVTKINYETGESCLVSPDGAFCLCYEEGKPAITSTSA